MCKQLGGGTKSLEKIFGKGELDGTPEDTKGAKGKKDDQKINLRYFGAKESIAFTDSSLKVKKANLRGLRHNRNGVSYSGGFISEYGDFDDNHSTEPSHFSGRSASTRRNDSEACLRHKQSGDCLCVSN